MKQLLSGLVLLWLCSAQYAQGQSLTLDQLIYLNGQEQMALDAYLVQRGWVFDSSTKKDSTLTAYWFYNLGSKRIGEVAVINQVGRRKLISYTTSSRASFDAIRTKATIYNMASLGVNNDNDGIRSFYRGNKYALMLQITPGSSLNYHAAIQVHGLTRAYEDDGTGKLVPTWVDLSLIPPPSEEQKSQWQATYDSIEVINRRRHR